MEGAKMKLTEYVALGERFLATSPAAHDARRVLLCIVCKTTHAIDIHVCGACGGEIAEDGVRFALDGGIGSATENPIRCLTCYPDELPDDDEGIADAAATCAAIADEVRRG